MDTQSSFDVDLNLDLSADLDSNFEIKNYSKYLNSFDSDDEVITDKRESKKKESKVEKKDSNKNKSEKNYTETFKIDLDKSDSIDDFIKFLSSQENISIDDLLSFNTDFNGKMDSFSTDKLNMKFDTKNILNNNFDFNINDSYLNSDFSYNSKYNYLMCILVL